MERPMPSIAQVLSEIKKNAFKISTPYLGEGNRFRFPRFEDKLNSVESHLSAAFTFGVVHSTA
jgi:hypothetical protein